MIDLYHALLGGGGITAILVALTRWHTARGRVRVDLVEALTQRLAKVEGRADEQSRTIAATTQALADARVAHAEERARMQATIDGLQDRIETLEAERDAAHAEIARLRQKPRRTQTPPDFPAQRTPRTTIRPPDEGGEE